MEKLICGKTKEYIRKAYFDSKLAKLLNEIQSEGKLKEKDVKLLHVYLDELKEEDKKNSNPIVEKYNKRSGAKTSDINPPTTDKLYEELNGKEKEKFDQWKEDCELAIRSAKVTMHNVRRERIKNIEVNRDKWADYSIEIIALMSWFSQYEIYCEQGYRKRLTDIIDKYHCSRAEAEERARITPEYREYKLIKHFREDVREFHLACKKRAGLNDD